MSSRWTAGRRLLAGCCTALLLVAASGCGGDSADGGSTTTSGSTQAGPGGSPQPGGSLVVGAGQDMQTFDPFQAIDQPSTFVNAWVFDSLFVSDESGRRAVPALATGIDFSADKLTATLRLRSGVRFQDGSPMTSADVVFSLRQLVASPAIGSVYAAVRGVRARGETVEIALRHPETDLAQLLATSNASVVPANYGGASRAEFQKDPIGTGPFRVVSRTPGVEVQLVRNPDYWQAGRPYLDRLTYRVYNDVNALSTAFQAGEVQLVNMVPLAALEAFESGTPSFVQPPPQTQTLTVNGRSGPLAELPVRQAISHAIDREALVQGLLGGHGSVGTGLLQPAVVPDGTELDAAPYEHDSELARSLLAESPAGGRPIRLELTYATGDATTAALAQALQSELDEVGIELRLTGLDPSTAIAALVSGRFELGLAGPYASAPTASAPLGFFIQTGGYGGGWDMARAQASLDAYVRAADEQERAAAVEQFERDAGATLPGIPLYNPYSAFVAQAEVGGFEVNPMLVYRAQDLWLAK